MKEYTIPCSWQMYGYMKVEADSLKDAIKKADDMPLPDGDYVTDSFEVDEQMVEELNKEE